MQVVAVAEPREPRRKEMAACHGVPDEMTFHSWEQLKGLPKLGDAVVRRRLLTPRTSHLHLGCWLCWLDRGGRRRVCDR